jgi:16S rRNA (cytidine1402-2'-O)-methyltransferase
MWVALHHGSEWMPQMLYVVATPIGNLADISARAQSVLRQVDYLAVEDTRHSRRLLVQYGIDTPMVTYHDHNESSATERIIRDLVSGKSIALISDAGTPLVSDPGYRLISAAVAQGIVVSPIPGPSALVSALSVSALPTDRFCFEGFLPARTNARKIRLATLKRESRTQVYFEAPHRVLAFLADVIEVMGPDRRVTLARELTKTFEQLWYGNVLGAHVAIGDGAIPCKGEFVIVLAGSDEIPQSNLEESRLMEILLRQMSPSAAASLGSEILGVSKKQLYDVALLLKKQ